MAYSPTYTSTDASPILIDIGLTILAVLIPLATVIGLIFVYRWYKKNK